MPPVEPLSGPLRRVARAPYSSEDEDLNSLWTSFLPVMEWVTQIEDPSHKSADASERRSLYTALRTGPIHKDRLERFKGSLEADLRELPDHQVGYTEADVLHWAFHVPSRPLLLLVGHRGAGKSTLVRYLFHHLANTVKSLKRFWTVFVDFRSGHPMFRVSDDPTLAEVVGRVYWEVHDLAFRSRTEALRKLSDIGTLYKTGPEDEGFIFGKEAGNSDAAILICIGLIRHLTAAAALSDAQLVLVFDNIDQLEPAAIERTFTLAAALCTETDARVILPQRPSTDHLHAFQTARRGGLITWRINVPAPDMYAVVRRRFEAAARLPSRESPGLTTPNGVKLEYKSIGDIFDDLASFTQRAGFTDRVLTGICGSDTRRKISALRAFLRWTRLPVGEFFKHEALARAGIHDNELSDKLRQHHILSGLMCGPRPHFIQSDNPLVSPILNLFALPSSSRTPAYTLMFRALTWLRENGGYVRKDDLLDALVGHGHTRQIVLEGVEALLKWGLIYSPEHDWNLHSVKGLKLASSGEFYLGSLLEDANYIFELVLDIPLRHETWSVGQADVAVSARYGSMRELLLATIEMEVEELRGIMSSPAHLRGEVARIALLRPQLSELVARALERKLQDGRVSRRESVKQSAEHVWNLFKLQDQPRLEKHLIDIRAMQDSLPEVADPFEKLGHFTIGEGLAVVVEGPRICSSAREDYLALKVHGPKIPDGPDTVWAVAELSKSDGSFAVRRRPIRLRVTPGFDRGRAREVTIPIGELGTDPIVVSGNIWFVDGDRVLGGGAFGAQG
jgi:hypothetical protein